MVTVTMPSFGAAGTEGVVLAWAKQTGDRVVEGETLVEVSTDAFDTEIPSPATGVLLEILVPQGGTVGPGASLAVLSDVGVSEEPPGASVIEESPTSQVDVKTQGDTDQSASVRAPRTLDKDQRVVQSPVELSIGRDVEPPPDMAASDPPQSGVVSRSDDVKKISRLRSRIAGNLIHAKRTAAHVWTSIEVDYERVAGVRSRLGPQFKEAEGFSLTYLPFVARATIEALAVFPAVNSLFDIDEATHTFHQGVNLGIAVDLNQKGLVVANVPDADSMTLRGLARSIRQVATDARGGSLGPDGLTGYTFTITNPGPHGSFMTAPIIAVPNAAILSTDTVAKRPVVVELPDGSDSIAIHHIGYLGLSWDHRVFDGSTAVLFLSHIKNILENREWGEEL